MLARGSRSTASRRSSVLAIVIVAGMTLAGLGGPSATAEGGVPGSEQHVYYAGAPAGSLSTPSTPIPDCKDEPDDPPDCWRGPKLLLDANPIGQTASEPTIGIGPDGTAYMAGSTIVVSGPLVYGGARTDARRSTDGGKTWTSIQPTIPTTAERLPPVNADPMIYVDPATGRVFTFDLTAACQWLSYSDDKGQSWIQNPFACGTPPVDHQTIVAAKPRGGLVTTLYPNALFYCANQVLFSTCNRSLDGGITWQPAGAPAYGPVGSGCAGLHGHLEADPDGRLYLPTSQFCNGGISASNSPWLARSDDSGLTWTRSRVSTLTSATPHTSVAADAAGNVYYVFVRSEGGDAVPYLVVSKDRGQTWGQPMMIAPPGVRQANFPVVAAGDPGKIAIAFPSTKGTASNRPWDQTVVVSANALDAAPVFLSATGNPPTDPIHRGACGPGRCGGMWDFIDIQISAAGEAWVSASDDCIGSCNTGTVSAAQAGNGIAVRQIGGPSLRAAAG